MRRAVLLLLCLSACGRSALSDPASEPVLPATHAPPTVSTPTPSPLIGHWAEFHLGNCINDEAWLSFTEGGQLTVTSVDRNYCGPHGVASSQGTWVEGPETLKLSWKPGLGSHDLERTWAVIPRTRSIEWQPDTYRFGSRAISMRVWSGDAAGYGRLWRETIEEGGKRYVRDARAELSFDVSPVTAAEGAIINARLRWVATLDWGDAPRRQLDETFNLPCRVKTELGERRVKAVVLDQYDGFWKLLTARGLDKSYGWDLDQLIGAFGPDWTVDSAGRLLEGQYWNGPEYEELLHPPPAQP